MAAATAHDSLPEAFHRLPLEELAPAVLRQGGALTFMATGSSMWPHIRHGDTVTAAPLKDGEAPRTGWIIIYFSFGKRIAVHRVLGRPAPGLFRVRGDARGGRPELVLRESVLGRIVSRKRRGRTVDLTGYMREVEGKAVALTGVIRIFAERSLQTLLRLARRRAKG